MKVIFLEDFGKEAKSMEVQEVRNGYGRNFLIPKGLAVEATPGNLKKLHEAMASAEKKKKKRVSQAKEIKNELKKLSITISAQSGQEDKLFGAVTQEDIAVAIAKEIDFEVNRHQILLEQPIKKLGIYKIPVRLSEEVIGEVKIWVVSESQ